MKQNKADEASVGPGRKYANFNLIQCGVKHIFFITKCMYGPRFAKCCLEIMHQ